VSNRVNAMHRDPDGVIWLGTDGGVSRYDGKEFVKFTPEDGLAHNIVTAIHRDQNGVMWFGTDGCCVSRYDGKEFVNFSIADGLGHSSVCIHRDPDGVLWFGIGGYTSDWLTVGGVFRYDARGMGDCPHFVNLTT
jgi:ligand-binding sensor domain-containing protein